MKLNQLPKEDFFKVPDNYFDELPSQIMKVVENEHKIVRRRRVVWLISSSVAAVMILLLGISFFFSQNNETTYPLLALDSVKTEQKEGKLSLVTLDNDDNDNIAESSSSIPDKTEPKPQPSNHKKTSSKPSNTDIPVEPELDFCSLDNQIIDYYNEELTRNEYYELK
ncbi:MAG TPA: hypothetical protein P5134_04250 [Bacteroidales bacterium]|jgi:cytoskeletal protein RodZ|nr:hypothetical protein [Bacteroidales bacterium]HOS57915.1 hypothetical protein [Bacteroidales bacterium]HRT13802.1 hypothetical protein [Bacteroidales bacterium]HXK73570.1 hypothetical protein [Bacteroidales bacterium]